MSLKGNHMDIREVSSEEKRIYIDRVREVFDDLRKVLKTLEQDMESEDLIVQASAVWISGNMANWYNDFMRQIRELEKAKQNVLDLQQEIKEIANERVS